MRTLIALLLLLTATTTHAQWTKTAGPEGGTVRALAYHNGTVLAALQSGDLYSRSAPSGLWSRIGELEVYRLESTSSAILAETPDGVARSTDDGRTWAPAGLTEHSWMLAASGDTVFATTGAHVIHRSTDGGHSWSDYADLGPGVQTIAFSGSLAVVGKYEQTEVMRTTDDGETWSTVGTGLPKDAMPEALFHHRGSIYASVIVPSPFQTLGIYRSDDSGATWHTQNAGLTNEEGRHPFVRDIFSQGGRLSISTSAGVYRFGGHPAFMWIRTYANFVTDVATTETPLAFFGTLGGVVADDIEVSVEIAHGMPAADVNSIVANEAVVLAATNNGVHRTTDRGATWLRTLRGRTIEIVAATSGMFAWQHQLDGDVLSVSVDDGATWRPAQNGLPNPEAINAIAASGPTVYVGLREIRAEDETGSRWRSGGVYRTTDNGTSWTAVNNGLPSFDSIPVPIEGLAVIDDAVIAHTIEGVFRSMDRGASWSQIDLGSEAAPIVTIAAHAGDFFISAVGRVLRSTDNGATWSTIRSSEELRAPIARFFSAGATLIGREINASETAMIYALVDDRLVAINDRLPEDVTPFSFAYVGERVMLGTFGSGVWIGRLDVSSGVADELAPSVVTSVFPTPAVDRAHLVYDLPHAAHVSLELFDAAGSIAQSRSEGMRNAGTHAITLDLSALAPGVYIYRLETGATPSTGRLIKR